MLCQRCILLYIEPFGTLCMSLYFPFILEQCLAPNIYTRQARIQYSPLSFFFPFTCPPPQTLCPLWVHSHAIGAMHVYCPSRYAPSHDSCPVSALSAACAEPCRITHTHTHTHTHTLSLSLSYLPAVERLTIANPPPPYSLLHRTSLLGHNADSISYPSIHL